MIRLSVWMLCQLKFRFSWLLLPPMVNFCLPQPKKFIQMFVVSENDPVRRRCQRSWTCRCIEDREMIHKQIRVDWIWY